MGRTLGWAGVVAATMLAGCGSSATSEVTVTQTQTRNDRKILTLAGAWTEPEATAG